MSFDNFSFTPSTSNHKKPLNSNIKIAIVIGGAILIGFIVYLIASIIFTPTSHKNNKTKEDDNSDIIELSIKNKDVVNLYNYVNYKTNVDNQLFIRNPQVEYENFTTYDMYYYITQFINDEDLKELPATDNSKIYYISETKMDEYMKKFFGKKVSYEKNIEMDITLPIEKDGKNGGILKYIPDKKYYTITLNSNNNIIVNSSSYITNLYKAFKTNKELIIEEKIIYISIKEENSKYNIKVYKDYNHTMLLGEKNEIDKNSFNKEELINEYSDNANTITYTYDIVNNKYQFKNSKLDIK